MRPSQGGSLAAGMSRLLVARTAAMTTGTSNGMKAQQETPQISEWTGSFGREYTDRNPQNAVALDALYRGNYGVVQCVQVYGARFGAAVRLYR